MAKREQLTVTELVLGNATIFSNPANTAPGTQTVFKNRAFKVGDMAISASPVTATAAIWFCTVAGVGTASTWKSLTIS